MQRNDEETEQKNCTNVSMKRWSEKSENNLKKTFDDLPSLFFNEFDLMDNEGFIYCWNHQIIIFTIYDGSL